MKNINDKNSYDVIILGSGPAGLEAAIYTSRSRLKTLVLGKKENSRLFKAHLISNYFGFPVGISGKDILERGIKQAKKSEALLRDEEAIDIAKENSSFKVKTPQMEYFGKSILLATGVKNVSSGISGEEKFIGQGVSFCVACDGAYFQDKKVGVLGEGDFVAEETLELLKYTKDITLFLDGQDFKAGNEIKKELEKRNIKFEKSKIKEFFGKGKLEGVITKDSKKISLDGIFIAKGTPKASDFAYKLGVEILNDYIKCDNMGKTNVPGIFVAGDVTGLNLQLSNAVGSGANAAFSIMSFLNKEKNK